jgi:hypothetical protein
MPISEKAKQQIAEILVQDAIESDKDFDQHFATLDEVLLTALRDVGRRVVTEVGREASRQQEALHRADGFTVESRTTTPFLRSSGKSRWPMF